MVNYPASGESYFWGYFRYIAKSHRNLADYERCGHSIVLARYQLFQELGKYKDAPDYLKNFSVYSVLTYVKRTGSGYVSEEKYEYDSKGNLASGKFYRDSECTSTDSYQYNADNLLIRKDSRYTSGSHWWEVYEYDTCGNNTAYLVYRNDHDGIYHGYYYEYDANGQIICETQIFESGVSAIYEYVYTYDEEGRVVKSRINNSNILDEYVYNEKGLLSQESVVFYNGTVGITEYQYDDDDRLIFTSYEYDGEISSDHSYEYDSDGNLWCEVIKDYDGGRTTYIYNTYSDIIVYNPEK